jgi:hypothetical protein
VHLRHLLSNSIVNASNEYDLIIRLCILLRVYQLNTGRTSVRNKVFFSAGFYCALLTQHVSALDIFFVFTNHLKMAAKQGRNM